MRKTPQSTEDPQPATSGGETAKHKGNERCAKCPRMCGPPPRPTIEAQQMTQETRQNSARGCFAENATATCRGCLRDLQKRPRAPPVLFGSCRGVAGGRRWRASLAGVAGGRRWRSRRRSRTKTAVISITGTKTRHTHKPRKHQTAHCERRRHARNATAECGQDTAD